MGARAGLNELSSGQGGLFTAAQAVGAGVSRMQLSREVARGQLERLIAGVYRDSAAPVDPLQGVRAAWLASEPDRTAEDRLGDGAAGVVVGGATAAYLHGIGDLQPEPVELHSRRRRQTERGGIRYRIRRLEDRDVTLVNGLPVTRVERTLADLVADRIDLSLIVDAIRDSVRNAEVDIDRLAELLEPSAARLGQPDGAALLAWLADTGQVELQPARTMKEVRERWLQQAIQIALPDLEPLRRSALAGTLDATHLQHIVAAVIRSGTAAETLRAAAAATTPSGMAELQRAVSVQMKQLAAMQDFSTHVATLLRAAGRTSPSKIGEQHASESS